MPGAPLSEADIAAVANHLLDTNLLLEPGFQLKPDSSFFDFHHKVHAVVGHFRRDGLTLPDYLRAAVMQPSLFCQSHATIICHVNLLIDLYR
jgi:hypothetical protein